MKPALTWTIALGGLLLLAGAMAWATRSLVGMERTQHRMAGEAAVQERSRLALWRMESLAAALVVGESGRPPDQYRSQPATAPQTSPASRVLLHFELDPGGRLRSPQVMEGPDKPVVPDQSALRLEELRTRLAEKAGPDQWALPGLSVHARGLTDNRSWLAAANNDPPPAPGEAWSDQLSKDDKQVLQEQAAPPEAPSGKKSAQEYAPPQLPSALKPAQARQEQDFSNKNEARMRQQIAGDLAKVAASQSRLGEEVAKMKQAPSPTVAVGALPLPGKPDRTDAPASLLSQLPDGPPATEAAPELRSSGNHAEELLAEAAGSVADAAPRGASVGEKDALIRDALSPTVALAPSGAPAPAAAPASPPMPSAAAPAPEVATLLILTADPEPAATATVSISDFRALWIKDALLLTRRVRKDGASYIQGAWVDWPQLRGDLLAAVSDLFPAASLEPAPAGTAGGTDLLASLPIRFHPGRLVIPAPPFWSPLRLSLATAWACVLLASGAVALVLRGMMTLSEHRAAFVSAVTHELRTPLATFKLYSEMLADGLVKEETKRQHYLETLSTEADRLGHLVENVLSYSRLERGKGSNGRQMVTAIELIQRVAPRLAQRTAQAGAGFFLHHEALPDGFVLNTDPSAVEQILFNLVDNACKYASRAGESARLELVLTPAPAALQLAVRDHGPGISRAEARRLFRPFHKSAREAAHTAPGVGLGLALCRRLARDLGGTLEIDHTWPHGASLVLTLPA